MKRQRVLVLTILLLVSVAMYTASAQESDSLDGYAAMKLVRVGEFTGSLDGRVEEMIGGVEIVLISASADNPDLPLEAETIHFRYEGDKKLPSSIELEGNVRIKHPDANIQAERATWTVAKGELVFTGNPTMDSAQFKGLRAKRFIVNLQTRKVTFEEGVADRIPLFGDSAPADPSLLSADDIADWPGLLGKLKEGAASDAASPSKQVVSILDDRARTMLVTIPADTLLAEGKDDLVKQFNKVLGSPELYSAAAWEGVELAPEADTLLAKETRTALEQTRLNRLLLQVAFPKIIQ